ncbi:MAG: hypothetical protein Unbinned2514contig1001_7 [Prokaryotic dsDNA virus sp.]|nr:MAG: hypothetical protein Unbinned2514contig1001_7 [Prokaryotic dsDNA virus sp.]|tara:strand:- start:13278 stop:13748 length:471 start_codon:yes stop_codon:yes gene_type:complete
MPVKIHGKEYMTVAERIALLHKNEKRPFSILTELVSWENGVVIMKATLIINVLNPEGDDSDMRMRFNGYAYERESTSQINKTSALENCETSAIGRCLAAAGYGGSEYASANEVENAIHHQKDPKYETRNYTLGETKKGEPTWKKTRKTKADNELPF